MAKQVSVALDPEYAGSVGVVGASAPVPLAFGYQFLTIIPKSVVPSINFRSYPGYLFDAHGKLETGFKPTLRASIQEIDNGVFAVNCAMGTRDHTYGLNTLVNINGNRVSIASLTPITSSLGNRSASHNVLVSGVAASHGNDGTLKVTGAQMYPPFFRHVDGTAIENTWSKLFDSIAEYKRGVDGAAGVYGASLEAGTDDNINFSPGEVICMLVNYVTIKPQAIA